MKRVRFGSIHTVLFAILSFMTNAPSYAQTPKEIKEFYDRTILEGQTSNLGYPVGTPLEIVLEDIETRPEKIKATPWMGSMVPHLAVRRFIYERDLGNMHKPPELIHTDGSPASLNGKEARKAFLISEYQNLKLKNPPIPFPKNTADRVTQNADPELTQNKLFLTAACTLAAPGSASLCRKMVNRIVEVMNPVESLTALDVAQTVMTDERYSEAASILALKLMDKVDSLKSANPPRDLGTLFQDTWNSMIEAGVSSDEAENMAWNLITVYSSRAANIYRLYPYAENTTAVRTLVSLGTIASCISILDSVTHSQNRLYSLPRSVKTLAHYGKPYHFWMAAYLSRRMILEFGDSETAMAAAALSSLAYQVFSTTSGREKLIEQVAQSEYDSPLVNKIRIDLEFGFSGAVYGAYAAQHWNLFFAIDLNQVTRYLFKPAPSPFRRALIELLPKRLKPYAKWLEVVRPFGLLKLVKQQTVCSDILAPSERLYDY